MGEKAQGRWASLKTEIQSMQLLWSPMKRSGWKGFRDLSNELRFRDVRQRVGIAKRVMHAWQRLQKLKP